MTLEYREPGSLGLLGRNLIGDEVYSESLDFEDIRFRLLLSPGLVPGLSRTIPSNPPPTYRAVASFRYGAV